jgi:hypothetical protein
LHAEASIGSCLKTARLRYHATRFAVLAAPAIGADQRERSTEARCHSINLWKRTNPLGFNSVERCTETIDEARVGGTDRPTQACFRIPARRFQSTGNRCHERARKHDGNG